MTRWGSGLDGNWGDVKEYWLNVGEIRRLAL
jgi:hypothetical protein